ncbi:putative excinuclease ATPase subunit [Thiocapsa sp. KS1]|nr:AAA family ATPase [Thiocapsa sp. KS1]CRI63826.1 putative excinuclease ATPase subunit [Thiocapsa sp. KS1]
MRVTEIAVKGLFGIFNHRIPLVHSDRVTIIHGPNGLGKTMMLKMIAALIDGRTAIFERVPFEQFVVHLDDNTKVVVRHLDIDSSEEKRRQRIYVSKFDALGNELFSSRDKIPTDVPSRVLDRVDQRVPPPFSRSGNGWKDDNTRKFYSLDEIIELFPATAGLLPKEHRTHGFSHLFEGLEVFFVETTRLNAERAGEPRSPPPYLGSRIHHEAVWDMDDDAPMANRYGLRVDQYSRDIVRRIESGLADYAKHSQESDRTFPERLVRFVRAGDSVLSERKILDQMNELENKRQRLISLGFLDSESGLRDLTDEDVQRVQEALTIYVGDVQKKLSAFDDLSQRVGKLIDIVNERFRYKTLTLNRDQGFRLRTTSGEKIELEDLSSGEQHELVVLYELLFRAPRNGLVLVDEPEISLHVGWQSSFLSDLMAILQLTGSYGIVATHSPVIIGSRWDLTQELKGPEEQQSEGSE